MTTTKHEGGCLCGGVRYAIAADPLAFIFCHCKDCQRCTGGPFAAVVAVPSEALAIVKGEPRSFSTQGEEGRVVWRRFCPDCGSPLFSGLEADGRVVAVKAGSLDDSSGLQPSMHIWTDSAVRWLPIHDDLPKVPRNPGRARTRSKRRDEARDSREENR